MGYRQYEVTVQMRYADPFNNPSNEPWTMLVFGTSRAHACKGARRELEHTGVVGRQCPATFKAVLADRADKRSYWPTSGTLRSQNQRILLTIEPGPYPGEDLRQMNPALAALRYHVSGAIARGTSAAITENKMITKSDTLSSRIVKLVDADGRVLESYRPDAGSYEEAHEYIRELRANAAKIGGTVEIEQITDWSL